MAGLYIHIPFCESRCIYCGFYSTTLSSLKDDYVDAVCHEMEIRHHYLPDADRHIDTIYLGGGTPSTLSGVQLEKIFDCIYNKVYCGCHPTEITMECNPDDITEDMADIISTLPVNRVSMGAQTFNDDRLHFLHRRHTAEDVRTAVDRLRKKGIDNISVDLMYGLPDETLEDWESDIQDLLALNIDHISAYSLMIEENTVLYDMKEKGLIEEADEELSRTMYEELIRQTEAKGYEHYEISNFALPGKRSRHNSSYWNAIPYIGIGAAAHSYDMKSRQWNISDVRKYIDNINRDIIPAEKEVLDISTRYNDMITTSLRTSDGINMTYVKETYGNKYVKFLLENSHQYLIRNLMELIDDNIRITREGLFVSDAIMSDLMYV